MAKFKLTFKKDYGTFNDKIKAGQTLIIEASTITYDKIKEAAASQLGVKVGPVSSDYYILEKL